jgi:hypothetical protein
MALKSEYLRGDAKLEAAAVSNPAHITPGSRGDHVGKIQRVLITLDDADIDDDELREAHYGETTADAVFDYKNDDRRKIINKAYQNSPDRIVGIMTMASMDREMEIRQIGDPDSDFIAFDDDQVETIKTDLRRSQQMLDVVLRRLRNVAHMTASGDLLVTPHNLEYYDTKLKVNNVFHINTFEADDLPVPDDIMRELRRRFRGLQQLPAPSTSPSDALAFTDLLLKFTLLRSSFNQRFLKENYRQGTFHGDPLGFFAAFVDAKHPNDPTVRLTRRYFDPLVMPTGDDRAVTLAHERAHTIFRANGHPGTGDNPFCVAPHLGDPNVTNDRDALANPYCFEWLVDALQPNYNSARFRGPECGT